MLPDFCGLLPGLPRGLLSRNLTCVQGMDSLGGEEGIGYTKVLVCEWGFYLSKQVCWICGVVFGILSSWVVHTLFIHSWSNLPKGQ